MKGRPKRYDHAKDLRDFALEVEALELASRKDPESPHLAKRDLVQRMRRRADQVVRADEPTAESVFRSGSTADPKGRRVVVEIARRKAA